MCLKGGKYDRKGGRVREMKIRSGRPSIGITGAQEREKDQIEDQ